MSPPVLLDPPQRVLQRIGDASNRVIIFLRHIHFPYFVQNSHCVPHCISDIYVWKPTFHSHWRIFRYSSLKIIYIYVCVCGYKSIYLQI